MHQKSGLGTAYTICCTHSHQTTYEGYRQAYRLPLVADGPRQDTGWYGKDKPVDQGADDHIRTPENVVTAILCEEHSYDQSCTGQRVIRPRNLKLMGAR